MRVITPRQRDVDYLVLQLWRARVWMNQQRRARQRQAIDAHEIPPLLRQQLERA